MTALAQSVSFARSAWTFMEELSSGATEYLLAQRPVS